MSRPTIKQMDHLKATIEVIERERQAARRQMEKLDRMNKKLASALAKAGELIATLTAKE